MKRNWIFIVLTCISFHLAVGQNEDEFKHLKSSMKILEEGELSLFLLDEDNSRRFFIEKSTTLIELHPNNFKQKLDQLTSDKDLDTFDVKFNIKSISSLVRAYNSYKADEPKELDLGARFGFWGGVNNFVQYPSVQDGNENNLFFGIELEAFGRNKFDRHAAVFQLRKSIAGDVVDLDLTELMIGYRLNAINTKSFIFYFELEMINFSYYNLSYTDAPPNGDSSEPIIIEDNGRLDLDTPLSLGAGIAVQLSKGIYFTLGYSNLVQLNTSRSDFPVDIRTGLKFNL